MLNMEYENPTDKEFTVKLKDNTYAHITII